MDKFHKFFLIVISIIILFSFHAFANEDSKLEESSSSQVSIDQYRAGAIVGTVVGFGMGHLMQNRYTGESGKGWLFTIAEPAPFAIILVGSLYEWMLDPCSGDAGSHDGCSGKKKRIFATEDALKVATAIFFGIKIWEIVDVWSYTPTKTASSIPPKLQIAILPTSQSDIGLGLKLDF